MTEADTVWPPHGSEIRPWRQQVRSGTKADRTLREVEVSLPPYLAGLDPDCSPDTLATMDEALREITVLDRTFGADLAALGSILVRIESVASSKIEGVVATIDDYARALHGSKAVDAATSMAAATEALDRLMRRSTDADDISLEMLTTAHERLMREDSTEREYAGRVRDLQNWIGGSDHSPRNAVYVPPPDDLLEGYLTDLIDFVNRSDLPILIQTAVAHAQFESIHPFTDGNGRIGRALINVILRHRGATRSVVVPIASGLVGNRTRYFGYLTDYRRGDPEPIMRGLAKAALAAAVEAQATARRLAAMPDEWRGRLGRVRRDSSTDRLVGRLTVAPVFTADDAATAIGGPVSSIYTSIERLRTAGVIRPLTNRQRDQVWGAADVLDELDDLEVRIETATR